MMIGAMACFRCRLLGLLAYGLSHYFPTNCIEGQRHSPQQACR